MAWVNPAAFTTGEVVTAAKLNQQINSNTQALIYSSATVATAEATATTTYVDLTTSGPVVTLTTVTTATVTVACKIQHATANEGGAMSFAVSGATTRAAPSDDSNACAVTNAATTRFGIVSATYHITGLTAGSNTFTAKYRSFAATNCTFTNRNIHVIGV